MFIPFESISSQSRIWIYQAERALTSAEISVIKSQLKLFTDNWLSHASEVNGTFNIFYDRFIVLASDESSAEVSGCSIDKSVQLIQSLNQQLNLNLMDRKIAYLQDGIVKTADLKTFREMAGKETIQPSTLVFNNTLTTKASFDSEWLVPAAKSWAGKYFLLPR